MNLTRIKKDIERVIYNINKRIHNSSYRQYELEELRDWLEDIVKTIEEEQIKSMY